MKSLSQHIMLAHGGGGSLTDELLQKHIFPFLTNPFLEQKDDATLLSLDNDLVLGFTTDAYVVTPPFFPGGDIGRLAISGTVNDLAVMGLSPKWLSLSLILEEGFPLEKLKTIMESIQKTAGEAGVLIVTGDTKVIENRQGSGILITTSGIGIAKKGETFRHPIKVGDKIILSGSIGEHGLAVLSVREETRFHTSIQSDVAPLNQLIDRLKPYAPSIHFMRDPTRGGVAQVLVDLSEQSGFSLEIREEAIPVSPSCRHMAEVFGLDILTIANEGKLILVVESTQAEPILAILRQHPLGHHAEIIGTVTDSQPPLVELICRTGGHRIIQRPLGEDLPRIC